MDMLTALRFPFTFLPGEVEALYQGRQKFSREGLRRLHLEKCLQRILFSWHDVVTREPGEVYRYVVIRSFTKRKYHGITLLTVEYSFRGQAWRHSFQLERGLQGGLSGTLISKRRKSIGT